MSSKSPLLTGKSFQNLSMFLVVSVSLAASSHRLGMDVIGRRSVTKYMYIFQADKMLAVSSFLRS